MERSVVDRVELVFRALHPHRPSARGSAAWFRRQLIDRAELDVTPVTIHRWLTHGVPADRFVYVDAVLRDLETEARQRLAATMKELGP